MSEKQIVKGKVIKENIELWDKTWPNEPKNYHNSQGVVDFVITPNVLSWVNQGLVELYKGGAKKDADPVKAAPVEAPKASVEEPAAEVSDKEDEEATKKKKSKKKG